MCLSVFPEEIRVWIRWLRKKIHPRRVGIIQFFECLNGTKEGRDWMCSPFELGHLIIFYCPWHSCSWCQDFKLSLELTTTSFLVLRMPRSDSGILNVFYSTGSPAYRQKVMRLPQGLIHLWLCSIQHPNSENKKEVPRALGSSYKAY